MGEIFPFHPGLFSRLLVVLPKTFISARLLLPLVHTHCANFFVSV